MKKGYIIGGRRGRGEREREREKCTVKFEKLKLTEYDKF